jgi:hypothetical protein
MLSFPCSFVLRDKEHEIDCTCTSHAQLVKAEMEPLTGSGSIPEVENEMRRIRKIGGSW